MSQTSRRAVIVSLVLLLIPAPARAQAAPASQASHRASATKRIIWTVIGAGAGFAAGLFFGLDRFDDAVNSDRKVWISAIVGAVAGAVAGGTLSRNVAPGVGTGRAPGKAPELPFPRRDGDDGALRSRVRAANSLVFFDR